MKRLRVLVCGDREWDDPEPIRKFLKKLPPKSIVIHGAARGADSLAGKIAKKLGFKVKPYPAKWDKFGKSAGPIRNSQMLKEGKPNLIIAFHKNLRKSKGTLDMILKANSAGLKVRIYAK